MRHVLWTAMVAMGCGSVSGDKLDARPADSQGTVDAPPDTPMATCAATPTGLKARYRADNNADDYAGSFNGAIVGANFSYSAGKYGMAFQLDGVDDTVTVNDGDQMWPSGSLTLEAWIKTTSPNTQDIISKYTCGSQCPSGVSLAYFALVVEAGGHPRLDFRPDATANITTVVASTIAINDGNWHHIVGVRDAAAMMGLLYVDGMLAVSATPAAEQFGAMTNTDNEVDLVTIGSTINAGLTTHAGWFAGAIDEVAIYHSALTAAQVSAIYSAPDGKCL